MSRFVVIFLVSFRIVGAAFGQNAEVVKLEKLQKIISNRESGIQVINFWATWCAPCVKEMPLLEKLNQERKDIRVTLVSMDIDLDPNVDKVNKFVARKKILSRVIILDETNPNAWISQIDPEWSGALPATLVINGGSGKRKFVERELHEGELEKLIDAVK